MAERAYDSPTVTIELHVATASVLLESLMGERDGGHSEPELFSKAWHQDAIIRAVREALLHWPPDSPAPLLTVGRDEQP